MDLRRQVGLITQLSVLRLKHSSKSMSGSVFLTTSLIWDIFGATSEFYSAILASARRYKLQNPEVVNHFNQNKYVKYCNSPKSP